MGLMFWSLNNQWQGQSDAAIDYTGRWKLLQHAISRFCESMHCLPQLDCFGLSLMNCFMIFRRADAATSSRRMGHVAEHRLERH